MYQKIKKLENQILLLVILNLLIMTTFFLNVPFNYIIVAIIILDVIMIYMINKKSDYIKNEIDKARNILPSSVIKAVNIDKYGIIMYNQEDDLIVWENEFFIERFKSYNGTNIKKLFNGFLFNSNLNEEYLEYDNSFFKVIKNEESFIFKDVTKFVNAINAYNNEKDFVAYLHIDNVDELVSNLDDLELQNIMHQTNKLINEYAKEFNCLFRKYKKDGYVLVVKESSYNSFLKKGIVLLENVKKIEDIKYHLGISIGIGKSYPTLKELETEANNALNMALARGGDQIVVKERNLDYQFYGSGSEALEKRNRVKVRVIASTIRNLINKASNVIIMPHKNADMDAIGSCYAMHKFASLSHDKVFILADKSKVEANTKDAIEYLNLERIAPLYSEEQLLNKIDENTLLLILDTSNYKIMESQKMFDRVSNKVIIDHHRRGKDLLDVILSYIEPYASSTTELVSELLQFQNHSFSLEEDVATMMLAGIMVDTSYFTLRTGVRTFEAATFIKEQGASPLQAKEVLQISLDTYQTKLSMIQNSYILDNKIAIAKYSDKPVTRALLAQVAIELLEVKDIVATFVLGLLEDGRVGISGRGNGGVNVQTILEEFGGGGHYSMAAAQINENIDVVEERLIEIINKKEKGE